MSQRIPADQRSKALKYYYDNIDRLKEINRINAKKHYYMNKKKKLESNKRWRNANPERNAMLKKEWNKRRFFYSKAMMLKANKRGTLCFETTLQLARGLMMQWIKQRGRCALTGIKLDRTANADHIVPVCKGGTDNSNNFQWLTPDANQLKGSLTVQELAHMCRLVLENLEKRNLLIPPPLHAWPDTTAVSYESRERKQRVAQ